MGTSPRRERERLERHQLIIDTARRIAEAEGWESLTTRRLATEIEYSQPVLYSHFANMRSIRDAVAHQGFAALSQQFEDRDAGSVTDPLAKLRDVITHYLSFATENPATYDVMFSSKNHGESDLGSSSSRVHQLLDRFSDAIAPISVGRDTATLAELLWSTLHGVVTLHRDGRLTKMGNSELITTIIEIFASRPIPAASGTARLIAGGRLKRTTQTEPPRHID